VLLIDPLGQTRQIHANFQKHEYFDFCREIFGGKKESTRITNIKKEFYLFYFHGFFF